MEGRGVAVKERGAIKGFISATSRIREERKS